MGIEQLPARLQRRLGLFEHGVGGDGPEIWTGP